MKKILCIILALLLALSLFGCGASSAAGADNEAQATSPAEKFDYFVESSVSEEAGGFGGVMDGAYNEAYPESPADAPEPAPNTDTGVTLPSLPDNVKLIYTADISMESTAFDDAAAAISQLVEDCGGYFESSSLDNYSSYRTANYTIRIPAEKFDSFCGAISEMGSDGELLQVNSISRDAQDVGEAYYDTEARLATQRTKLERLQALLEKAELMEDIISLEYAISDTQLQIEYLTGELRHYDALVGYSTIHAYLNEVYKLSENEQPVIGFGAKLANALKTGCSRFVDDVQYMLLSIARNWVGWLIFLVIAAVVVVIVVRAVRRRKRARRRVPEVSEGADSENSRK